MPPSGFRSNKSKPWRSMKDHVNLFSGANYGEMEDGDQPRMRVNAGPLSIIGLQHAEHPVHNVSASSSHSPYPEDVPMRSSWRGSREVERDELLSSWRTSQHLETYFPSTVKQQKPSRHHHNHHHQQQHHQQQQQQQQLQQRQRRNSTSSNIAILPAIHKTPSSSSLLSSSLSSSLFDDVQSKLRLSQQMSLAPLCASSAVLYSPAARRGSVCSRRASVNSNSSGHSDHYRRRSSISEVSVEEKSVDEWPLSPRKSTKAMLDYLGAVAVITVNNLDVYNRVFQLDSASKTNKMISPTEFAANARALNDEDSVLDYEICYVMYVFNLCDEHGYSNIPRDYRLYGVADLLHYIVTTQRYSLAWAIGDLSKGNYDSEYQAAIDIMKRVFESCDRTRVGKIARTLIHAAIKRNAKIPRAKRQMINRAIKAACGDPVHLKEYLGAIPIFVKIMIENVDWDS